MKILHYTFTSLRLACSFSLLIACINIFHYFYTSHFLISQSSNDYYALTCETIVPLWLRTDKFYIFFLINTRI